MKKILFILLTITFTFVNCKKETPIPIPSEPEEVTIGFKTWKTKNLDVSTYRNGDPIPQVQNDAEWAGLTTGAWCYYNNDPSNGTKYGKLYNWYAVNDSRGLAPEGWHVPSDAEWTILADYLGGWDVAGGKMKSTLYWQSPNTDASNESGFSGLPSGYREFDGFFYGIVSRGSWWSSSEDSTFNIGNPWSVTLTYNSSSLFLNSLSVKGDGISVRCIKD